MPKITPQQAVELLTSAGIADVELVASDDLSDYTVSATTDEPITKDTLLQAIDTARSAIIAPRIIAEKQNEMHGKIAGKVNGTLRSALSQNFGIPTAELEGLNDKDAMTKAVTYYKSSISGDASQFQQKLDETIRKHEELVNSIKSESATQLSALQNKLTDKEVMAHLIKDHENAKGLPITAKRDALARTFRTHLDSQAIVKYNEQSGEVELYERSNPEMPLMNKTNTAKMKPADFMETYYKDLGLWNTDLRTVNPADAMKDLNLQKVEFKDNRPIGAIDKQLEMVENWAKGK